MRPNYKYQLKCMLCKKTYTTDKESKSPLCPACQVANKRQLEKEKQEEKRRSREEEKRKQSNFTLPKLGYTFELFKLSAETLSDFAFLDNRRKVADKQVANLYRLLCDGKHFDSPIVVNKRDGKLWLIDGNHRMEAFKKVLQKYPSFAMDILLIVYRNLDGDSEIEAFRRWNVGKVQSIDDFIQSIARKIPFIRWVKQDFPVNVVVYKRPETIGFRQLCNALISAMRDDEQGHGLHRRKFRERLMEIGEAEYKFAKGWIKRFVAIFGKPGRGSPYYMTPFFNASMYLAYWHQDKKNLDKRFREKVLGDVDVVELTEFGGRAANKKMIELLREKMRIVA